MINKSLILLLLEKCKDFVRRNVFHRQPPLEAQTGIVQELVKGIAVGLEFSGGVFHGHVLYAEQDQRLPLPVGQLLVDDAADADQHIGALGRDFRAGLGIGQQTGRRGNVFVFGQFVQRGIAPALAAQFGERDPDGDLVHPGGELTASFEGIQLVQDTQESFLGYLVDQGVELWQVRGEPAGERIGQTFLDNGA